MCPPRAYPLRASVLALTAFAALHASPAGAAVNLRGLASAVDSIASSAMRDGPLAGISVAIARHDTLVWAKGYGMADRASRRAVTTETIFPLCSISKHVAAVAVLRGDRLHLPDTVGEFLPKAPRAWRDITVRQLLTHTSGLVSYTDPALGWDSLRATPLAHEQVIALVAKRPLAFAPGTSWSYSNTAFYLLGMIVEAATRRSYGEYVQDAAGEPFGAPSLHAVTDVDPRTRAHGYRVSSGRLVAAEDEDWANPFAAGGLAATAADLAVWESRAWGAWRNVLGAPTILPDGTSIDYGLGTRLGRFGPHRIAGHSGNGNGFDNVVVNYIDDDLVIVVLTNSESRAGARALQAAIARHVLRMPPARALDLPVPRPEAAADTGVWEGDSGVIEVFASGDRLRWRGRGEPGNGRPLPYEGEGTFRIGPGHVVRFERRGPRAMWAQTYVEGLFDEAVHRVAGEGRSPR